MGCYKNTDFRKMRKELQPCLKKKTSESGQGFKIQHIVLDISFKATNGRYKVYVEMWGQAVDPLTRRQKVTTMRLITP